MADEMAKHILLPGRQHVLELEQVLLRLTQSFKMLSWT